MPEIEQQLAPGTPPTDYHAALSVPNVPQDYTPKHLTRSLRDFARISELTVGIVDSPLAMSGTAAFNSAHPLQLPWRDIHFISCAVPSTPGRISRISLSWNLGWVVRPNRRASSRCLPFDRAKPSDGHRKIDERRSQSPFHVGVHGAMRMRSNLL